MTTDREAELLRDAHAAGITRPQELANFMAQVGHESGGLRQLEESFRYTQSVEQISGKVRSALREGREPLEAARLEALAGRSERLAELMYGGRMGNDEAGDGYRYRGRGYIQLTGKNQYANAGEALDLDLVGQPDLAARPEHASRIATWYWQQNVPREARDDVRGAGAAINGRDPPNGLSDREHRFERWTRELTPERIRTLSTQEPGERSAQRDASLTFEDTMRAVLPPQARVTPHIPNHYGEHRSERTHEGTDFNYVGGQRGINRAHPIVHSPVEGLVSAGPDTREALANATRVHRTVESDDRGAAGPRVTALDGLLAAARDGDPATLRAALADLSESTIGRSFHAAQAGHAEEASRSAELAATQQGECGARG